MSVESTLPFHIAFGALGLLAGAAAMIFRKGSRRHRIAGNVFVVAMLSLSATGAYIGFSRNQTLNGLMGVLTFYLVATAWSTARRGDRAVDIFDRVAILVPLTVGAWLAMAGVEAANSPKGSKEGFSAAGYFIFASLALLFAAGDVRLLLRGSLSGSRRIARHLVRMCVALFIAAGSLFLGQPQVFPEWLLEANVLFVPSILPLALMLYWIRRVRLGKAWGGREAL